MSAQVQVWRVSAAGRVASILLACGMVFLAVSPLSASGRGSNSHAAAPTPGPAAPTTSSGWTLIVSGPDGTSTVPLGPPSRNHEASPTAASSGRGSWLLWLSRLAFFLPLTLLVLWGAFLQVTLTAQDVVIRTLFTTRRLPLAGITGVRAGSWGTVFIRRDEPSVAALGLVTSNLVRWSWAGARGGELAAAVLRAVEDSEADAGSDRRPLEV